MSHKPLSKTYSKILFASTAPKSTTVSCRKVKTTNSLHAVYDRAMEINDRNEDILNLNILQDRINFIFRKDNDENSEIEKDKSEFH